MIDNLIVSICNGGIRKSGQDSRITALDENSNLADLCNDVWPVAVDFVYSSHPWAFKKVCVQADLQTLNNDPIAEQGQNVYAYPAKALRMMGFYKDLAREYRDNNARVSSDANGNKIILSNENPLFVEYIMAITQNDSIPAWLREALELKVAIEVARAKGKDIRILSQELQAVLDSARVANASESEKEKIENNDYIDVRG